MSSFYPLLVPFAPLIAALLTALPRSFLKERNYKIGWLIIFTGFISSVFVLWQLIQDPTPMNFILFTSPWEVLPSLDLSIDRLAAVMMLVISAFGTLIYHYSRRYLQQDSGQGRYQTLFALMLSTLLFMVMSADLIMLFVFWQIVSWYLSLLSHNFAHEQTARSSFRIFMILRAGDLAFLSGIVLAYHVYGTVKFIELFDRAALDQTSFALFGSGFEVPATTLITILIFIGGMSKSAQFPLHMWLPDSLYGPTPVSALLHAGIINASGFLLNRLAPLYSLSSVALHIVLIVGLITAIFGTSAMLVQNDIKKTLGYSTIGQMGYMVMECGVGAFPLAVFHLIAHGLFKADVFLNCGKGIHEARLHPTKAPQPSTESKPQAVGWISAFIMSFVVPLLITIGAHYLLGISFLENQGLFVLFLFSWVTVSQAMLTLFRLKKGLLTKSSMLVVTALVAVAYFFAAESFTHFLIPNPHTVEAYYRAAELPFSLFLILATVIVLLIIAVWLFALSSKEKAKQKSSSFKTNSYLFFMNGLYFEGIAMRLSNTFKSIGRKLDSLPSLLVLVIALALVFSFGQLAGISAVPVKTALMLIGSALLVPLFPFHALYMTVLTRMPGSLASLLCALMPAAGVYMMISVLPEIPQTILPAISVLAIFGALWGSVKALMQVRVTNLLSYGALALYSILWWYFAEAAQVTSLTLSYAWSLTISWAALYFAWDRVRVRYGDLDLRQIGGLLQTMPRFAICMILLVMAALGLPPFSFFFAFLGILLSPETGASLAIFAIILTWFLACWYLFKLMQRLLFGAPRADIHYEDLRPIELVAFIALIALLTIPSGALEASLMEVL